VGLSIAALLLFGSVTLALELPAVGLQFGYKDATVLDYSSAGVFSPLRADFIRNVLGFLIPEARRETPAGPANSLAPARASGAESPFPGRLVVEHLFTNGTFASAYTIPSVPFTAKTNTTGATREPGEPDGCSRVGGAVWYRFTPKTNMALFADSFGTSYPTALAVLQGSALENLRQIGCDTNVEGNAQVSFQAQAGRTYYFQVTGVVRGGAMVFNLDPIGPTTMLDYAGPRGATGALNQGGSTVKSQFLGKFPAISGDGRFVAYTAFWQGNEGPDCGGPTGGYYECTALYLIDRVTGKKLQVTPAQLTNEGNWTVGWPSLSGDGRYLAFASTDQHLTQGINNGEFNVFVRDNLTGKLERVSLSSSGAEGHAPAQDNVVFTFSNAWVSGSFAPSISDDGRYIVFSSDDTDLVPGNTSQAEQVYVRDRVTRATDLVSINSDGRIMGAAWAGWSGEAISAEGRYVVFLGEHGNCANIASDTCTPQVYLRDRTLGRTNLISKSINGGEGNRESEEPVISADGSHVAFCSLASDLVPNDANGSVDCFEWTRADDAMQLVSVSSSGEQQQVGEPSEGLKVNDSMDFISGDGRYVAFTSLAPNLVPNKTNGKVDVFLHDLRTGSTVRLSVSSLGEQADGNSRDPALARDATAIVFWSDADNLTPGQQAGIPGFFLHQLGPEGAP